MERFLSHLTFLFAVLASFAIAFIGLRVFISTKASRVLAKDKNDKQLLRQLLEGFGLEIPDELNEGEISVIKSVKTP